MFQKEILPEINKIESCEKICLAIASTLRRAYKKPFTENIFENAIAQMNEELGKLASLGQIHWINKLNYWLSAEWPVDNYIWHSFVKMV